MGKFIYEGFKVIANSRQEAIQKIVAYKKQKQQRVIASATPKQSSWIHTALAGIVDDLVLEDTDAILSQKGVTDEIADVLNRYFTWNDKENTYLCETDFNVVDIYGNDLNKVNSFDELKNLLRETYSDEVSERFAKAGDKIAKIFRNQDVPMSASDESDLVERLVDRINRDYGYEKALESKWRCLISLNVTIPQFMEAIFGTDDIAKIAKNIIDRKYGEENQKSFEKIFKLEKLPSFEVAVLTISKNLGALKLRYRDDLTLKEIISTKNSNDVQAVSDLKFEGYDRIKIGHELGKATINSVPVNIPKSISFKAKLADVEIYRRG